MSTDWNQRYATGDTPWDSGLPSRELTRTLAERRIVPCRVAELGCGSGTNALHLASLGFQVTAFDLSEVALERARAKASAAALSIDFRQADLCRFDAAAWNGEPFDFLFDRGCYHCARKIDLPGYRRALERLSRPGTLYLTLTGNANDAAERGPPKLTPEEIEADLGALFERVSLRPFHFEDPGGVDGPLGWSCLMRRSATLLA